MAAEKPKRRLKNLTVQYISLVAAGANRRQVIYKNAGELKGTPVSTSFTVRKLDKDKRLVYGIVYAPDEVDTDGDTMDAVDIEKAAHEFLAAGHTDKVDKQHDQQADKGRIVESYILSKNDARFPDDPEGAWAVVIKVTDEATWKEVKKGNLKGISMQGVAEAETVVQETKKNDLIGSINKAFEDMKKTMKEFFNKSETNDFNAWQARITGGGEPLVVTKDFKAKLGAVQFRDAVSALESANWVAIRPEAGGDVKAALKENAQQFIAHIDGLNALKQPTNNEDNNMAEDKSEETKKNDEAQSDEILKEVRALNKEFKESFSSLEKRLQAVEKNAGISQAGTGQEDPTKVEKTETKGLKFL